MFSMEMREKTMDKIKLENISYSIFMIVMKYLYTDDCVINLEVSKAHQLSEFNLCIEFNGAF
jgi:hypothetical protein